MAKFKVEWCEEVKLNSGKVKKNATLKAENNELVENVGIWNDFPGFADIGPGREVAGKIVVKGNYTTLYPDITYTSFGAKPAGGFGGGAKAAEIRNKGIEEGQKRKDEAISYHNAINSAISILGPLKASLEKGSTPSEYQKNLIEWRDWILGLYKQHKEDKDDKPF